MTRCVVHEPGGLEAITDAIRTMDHAQLHGLYLQGTPKERYALEVAAQRVGRVRHVGPDGQVGWQTIFDADDEVIQQARQAVREAAAPELFRERQRQALLLRSVRSRYAHARALVWRIAR